MREELIRWYYAFGTPAFWLVDLIWDAPLRASFIGNDAVRYGYYAGCVACGIVMWKQPRFTRRIGMTESITNFTMALLAIWVPMYDAFDAISSGPVGAEAAFDPALPINAGMSGGFALLSFYSKMK